MADDATGDERIESAALPCHGAPCRLGESPLDIKHPVRGGGGAAQDDGQAFEPFIKSIHGIRQQWRQLLPSLGGRFLSCWTSAFRLLQSPEGPPSCKEGMPATGI
jgi:hypothetical protein